MKIPFRASPVHPARLGHLAACALILLAHPASAATAFTRVFAFGDSLSDSGNVHLATAGVEPASPPNFDGRFSNGPTWVEQLTTHHLGLPALSPSLAGGDNHAWGGAWTDGGGSVPTVVGQVGAFVGDGGSFGPTDLVTLWAGANDFFFGGTDPAASAANIGTALDLLATAGAEHVLIANLPELGLTPAARAQGIAAQQGLSALSLAFNDLLEIAVLSRRSSEFTPYLLDIESLNEEFIADPADFGLANVTDSALLTGNVAQAGTYAYWDGVHPTETVHGIFAGRAFELLPVPEPSVLLLMMTSAVALVLRRRAA